MSGYSPLKITGMQTGLVEDREKFLLPDDAYPVLQNAYVWRERILRKKGNELLGRLQRSVSVANALAADTINLISALSLESTASIAPGTISLVGSVDATTYTDPAKDGVLVATGGAGTGGSINYATGVLTITAGGAQVMTGTIGYYPGLPVMGIYIQELLNSQVDQTIFFDQKYSYVFNETANVFQEFIAGTTWNAAGTGVAGTDFFWATNYWVSSIPLFTTDNQKLFWVTNDSGHSGATQDPPRITDGTTWVSFSSSTWHRLDATNYLFNFLSMLPFRGRMLTFNTWEGPTAATSINHRQRIRWSTIGNPFIPYTAGPPAAGSWRDDIRGQGGFLDIPTAEDIVGVGFVRDNLVVFCERSTWQLRYTGRSISPFQIERVNSELGVESPYSVVPFDTSLMGIGLRGIIECDSYKAEKIDIKIPDFVFQLNIKNGGNFRIQGIRDFRNRLAFWTLPIAPAYDPKLASNQIFPNMRLVYNYENDSWSLFNDSFTTFGPYQFKTFRTWLNTPTRWIGCDFPWIDMPESDPLIMAGNQVGFVHQIDAVSYNEASLYISGFTATSTVTCPSHNLLTGTIIGISGVIGTNSGLNGGVYSVTVIDQNSFSLSTYSSVTTQFSTPVTIAAGTYSGGGLINVRDNFSVVSKKFNFLDEGQSIQLGYIDILMQATGAANPGAITLNVYLDYDDVNVSNTLPNNVVDNGNQPVTADTFFNSTIPTTPSSLAVATNGTKFWQRVFCPTRGNFLTLKYTLSNLQMSGVEQQLPVQIDAQVLWIRRGGRMTQS